MSFYKGRIIVGWKPQAREDVSDITPEFTHNKGTNDPEKQQRQIEEKQVRFASESQFLPYYATIGSATLADPLLDRKETFPIANSSDPIAIQIANWLFAAKDYFRAADSGECPFEFLGFRPKDFVKIWGTECAEHGNPVWDCVWIGVTNYKDIEHVSLGEAGKAGCTVDVPLKRFGIAEHHGIELPYSPFADPEMDMKVTFELASRLGMLNQISELAENAE